MAVVLEQIKIHVKCIVFTVHMYTRNQFENDNFYTITQLSILDTYVFTIICMDWIWTDSLMYTWKQHFQKFHSRESFLKVPLSVIIFIGYLWTEAISIENSCIFKWKQIHLDVALTIQAQRAPCAENTCNFSLHNNKSNVEVKRIEEMILN